MDGYSSTILIFRMNLILGIAVIGIAIIGMSVGIIFGRKPLSGSCNNQPGGNCSCNENEKESCDNKLSS